MKFANQKLILAGVVAAIMLSGCGKKAPTGAAAPVPFDDEEISNPVAPSTVPAEELPYEEVPAGNTQLTDLEPGTETPAAETPAVDPKTDEEAAAKKAADEAAAKQKADEEAAAKKKADDEAAAKKKADDEAAAKKKADEEAAAKKKKADEAAAKLAKELEEKTPAFKKVIGEGSLHSANGIAFASGLLYVVDNARTGLLGKFAAVRTYEVATGDFKSSFENIGWAGAKNLPTSVDRVKISDGKILAGSDTTTYTFSTDGALLETAEDDFDMVIKADVPDSDDQWRIKSGKVQRVDEDGEVLLTLDADELTEPVALCVDGDGNLFVTDAAKKAVVMFEAPEK